MLAGDKDDFWLDQLCSYHMFCTFYEMGVGVYTMPHSVQYTVVSLHLPLPHCIVEQYFHFQLKKNVQGLICSQVY